jgi:hypothetical protein
MKGFCKFNSLKQIQKTLFFVTIAFKQIFN